MAISVNNEVPELASDRVLITGIANLNVVGLNPTKEQLEKLGYKPKDEPVYLGENSKSGKAQMRVDIHLEGDVNIAGEDAPVRVSTKTAFWIENNTDRGVYIDKFGKFGKDTSKLDASARPAYNGELELIGFLKAICNVRPNEEISLDHVDKLASVGDLKELQGVLRAVAKAGNQVQCVLGVREGKYQDVFNRQFDYAGRGGSAYLHSQLYRQAEYERGNGKTPIYYGPINTLVDQYVPGQYLARRYSAEAQEAFEQSQPKGSFGQPSGAFPGATAQPAFQQPGQQFGGVPVAQPQTFHQNPNLRAPQPLQPMAMPIGGDDDNDLPF